MTKRTPLQRYRLAQESAKRKLREKGREEVEKTDRALFDPDLSPKERLDKLKKLQAWPRIVLGLYKAELAIARNDPKRNPKLGTPSDLARDAVGSAVELGADRIRDLCREGSRHLDEGMPARPEISAARFKRIIDGSNLASIQKKSLAEFIARCPDLPRVL
jgi:hypothetical protein